MRIAFDAKRYFHNNRGLGNYSRDVIRLLSSYYSQNDYLLFNPIKKETNEILIPENAQVIYPESYLYKAFPSLWRSRGCISQIRNLDVDIYHGLSQELPSGIHREKVKTVVTMHDAIFIRYPELYDNVYRKIFIKKNSYSTKVADRIIAISEQTKQDFIQYFSADASKIDVVYQGCNSIFRNKIDVAKKAEVREKYNLPVSFLLTVGAIEKRKNVELVVKALAALKSDIPYVVIGNKTTYYDEILQLIEKLNFKKRVIFRHNIETPDLPAIYAMSDVFIYPSVYEGFGIPILEALCVGVPVITSKGSCFEETGGDAAIYVDSNGVDELSDAIENVLTDSMLRQNMITKGFAHAENFTDEKIAHNLMNVYKKLV